MQGLAAMSTPMLLLVTVGILATCLLGFFAFSSSGVTTRRLARVGNGTAAGGKPKSRDKLPDKLTAVRQQYERGAMDRMIHRLLPNRDKLREQIQRTGRNITLPRYAMGMLAAAIFGFVLIHFAFSFSPFIAVIGGIGMGVWLPYKIVVRMANKRAKAFIANFPEAIDTMVRGLKSGLPVSESIGAVGREAPDPVGIEFRRIADAMRLGRSLDESMWDVAKRLDLPEFRFLITAMAIQRETGGNLGETLNNLSELLRRRRQLKLKIRAMSSEARASAMIIGSLPFVMGTLLYCVNQDHILVLFRDDTGNILLAGGSFWMFLGIMVMKKMIAFEI